MALRCLIVDDNEQFLAAARDVLERDGITVVAQATSASEALRQARELRPDLALLDVDLGDESGFAVARALVDGDAVPASGIVLVSAYDEADFEELIAASPVAGFVAKSDLSAAAIAAALRGTNG